MAANYNQFKQAWDMMDENQRKQQTELYKNNQQFQQFAQQYSNEKNNSNNAGVVNNTNQNNNNSNSNNQDGSTSHYDPIYYRDEGKDNDTSSNNDRKYYENDWYSSDWKNWDGNFYWKTNFDKEETLDKSMFNEAPWKITIEAGTGKDTGRPDYELWDATRENEMKHNLDEYYDSMPRVFSDRETFNKFFEYNSRKSDAQRELLDSYWKKKQDANTAATYTNADMLNWAFDSWDVTPWILDAIKEGNMDLYLQWQKKMQDDLNARIANYAVPRTATQTADIWMDLVKRLGIEAWDPYQIYDNWVWRCEQLWVFNMNNQLSQYISEMEQVKGERTAAMQRTMNQWAGRKSQALIDAEVSKTSALYDARFADLQNMYQATYNQRQQNLAIANASAQALQMQAQEDQRIFNNKITGLWFAMKVDDYRTPEQKSQNELRQQAISNDLQLLNKAKSNDLELYNKYATAKLENQLEYELQDLNVKDPAQLKANLSRVLDSYYKEYWDIIQRPKQQVIDDVLKLARESWMSVAEALKANFIQPLQNKDEYVQAVADKYWMNPTQSIQNIWDKVALVTKYPNGKMSYQILDDVYNPKYDLKTINWKAYMVVDDWNWVPQLKYIWGDWTVLNYASLNQWLQSFMSKYEDWTFYKEKGCWYFCNEYLTSIWDAWHVWSSWESKKALCSNKDWKNMVVWSIVAIDSWATYTNDKWEKVNAWHVSIVAWYDPATWKVLLYDANRDGKWHVSYHETTVDKLYWYYTPESYKNAGSTLPDYVENLNEYWFVDTMTWIYGSYLMWEMKQGRVNQLWWDDLLQKQAAAWLDWLSKKWVNEKWYKDWAEELYEKYLASNKQTLPSTAVLKQFWWVDQFIAQATAFWQANGYGRYTQLNDKWYYDDLVPLYNEFYKTGNAPTEDKVADYGGLDNFYNTFKAYRENNWYYYTPEEQDKEIIDMRDKWETTQVNKEMIDSIDALWKIQTMLRNGTSWYWDYTAVYLLNKLRDPDSVVREQEFSNTKNIWSIWDRINNYFQQIDSWKILNDSQKTQIYNEMNTLMNAKIEAYNNQLRAYRQKAIKWGDTSKIWNIYKISKKWNVSFGNLTWDIVVPKNASELED